MTTSDITTSDITTSDIAAEAAVTPPEQKPGAAIQDKPASQDSASGVDDLPPPVLSSEAPSSEAPPGASPSDAGPSDAGPSDVAPVASGTGAGQSDAPRVVIGAQESNVINANLAGLAAGTVRLAT